MEVHSPALVAISYSIHPGAPCQIHRAQFDFIAFQSLLEHCVRSPLPGGGVM